MGISKDKIFKELDVKALNLPSDLEIEEREDLMNEIGEYLLSEILDYVGQGISPVTGKDFKELSSDYADKEKGGNTLPNLDLNGDMMRAIEVKVEADKIKVGIFDDDDQAIKLYGHNTGFKGHPWLDGKAPQRKVIPDKKESFAGDIMSGINDLIEEFLSGRQDNEATQSS